MAAHCLAPPAGKQWALNNFYTALLTCQNIFRKNVAIFVSQSTVSTYVGLQSYTSTKVDYDRG